MKVFRKYLNHLYNTVSRQVDKFSTKKSLKLQVSRKEVKLLLPPADDNDASLDESFRSAERKCADICKHIEKMMAIIEISKLNKTV